MPRRKSQRSFALAGMLWIAALAASLFGVAEATKAIRSDRGLLWFARTLGVGDRARITRLVGVRLRAALERAGVRPDSLVEEQRAGSDPALRWRAGVGPDASLIQINFLLSRALAEDGVAVLSGREFWSEAGTLGLRLRVGLPRRATHELVVLRGARGASRDREARLAVVLFGIGTEPASADSFFSLPAPFAVALVPGARGSRATFRKAHERGREVLLHLPLEPINYPRVSPGPGTLLVTMKPSRVASGLRRHLAEAGPVAAVANHMGSLATQDMTLMRAVFHELRSRDLPFVHVEPAAGSVCRSLASDESVSYLEPDAVLDAEARGSDARALEKRWRQVLQKARARGRALVWIRATPLTRRWLTQALAPKRLADASVVPFSALSRNAATP